MSRRRRGSNPRSTHEEGYDEYSHDDEDEWDESEQDHTASSPSIPSRDQHHELAEEGVTRLFESEDDDSDADEASNSPPLDADSAEPSFQRPYQEWVDFHHTIAKLIKIVEESRLEESLRRLIVEDLTAQEKKAERNILANEFDQLAQKHLTQEATTTPAFQNCMKAGLEYTKVMLNASPVEAPTIDLEANSEVDVAIETARKHGLLSKSTRCEIDRQDEHRRFLEEMTKFQNEARKLASHTFPEFSAMLRSFVPDEIDLEYSKQFSMVDVNHKVGQEN
ncbi:MAG: hypothetical protein ACPICB_00410 [Candidatus Poseidoniaceae archaeon]